jgi:hypothetical protein
MNKNPFGLSDSAYDIIGFGLVVGAVLAVVIPLSKVKTA